MCETKICHYCKKEKLLTEFHKKGKQYRSYCKNCSKILLQKYRKDNAIKIKEKQQAYYRKNKEHILNGNKKWAENNQEKVKEYLDKHYKKTKKKRSQIAKENTAQLADSYIRNNLLQNNIPKDSITPELIEIKRLVIQLRREIKNEKLQIQ